MSHRLLRFCQVLCLIIITILTNDVSAAGLGRIKVFSYLNEPLDAEIELVGANDIENLLISIASQEEFDRATMQRSPELDMLIFQVVRDEDEVFIHATSNGIITEPYLDFLLNLSWGPGGHSGRIIRRYTILLDPVPIEGKPAYAKRRLMPQSVEKPKMLGKTQYIGEVQVNQLGQIGEAVEGNLLLNPTGAPLAQTPQEKAAALAKGMAIQTTSKQEQLSALFEHPHHPTDLKSVVEDVERIVISSRPDRAEEWFGGPAENKVQAEKTTPLETKPVKKPEVSSTSETKTPAPLAKSTKTESAGAPPVPTVKPIPTPGGMNRTVLTIVVIVIAGGLLLLVMWRRRQRFTTTREQLVEQSRESIAAERAKDEVETPLQPEPEARIAPTPVEEPSINMADLDSILAEPTAPAAAPTAPLPAVEEIQIDIGTLTPPLPAPPPAPAPSPTPEVSPTAVPISPEEIALKLQLAHEYIELGDFYGAKDLLITVKNQGTPEQRTEAQELLEKIV